MRPAPHDILDEKSWKWIQLRNRLIKEHEERQRNAPTLTASTAWCHPTNVSCDTTGGELTFNVSGTSSTSASTDYLNPTLVAAVRQVGETFGYSLAKALHMKLEEREARKREKQEMKELSKEAKQRVIQKARKQARTKDRRKEKKRVRRARRMGRKK
jgi:hypothetical protein